MRKYIIIILIAFSRLVVAQEPVRFDLVWGVKFPLRDGVKLNATLYLPDNLNEKLPVILDITPYISDDYHIRGKYFSQHGYVYAIIDCRGRGNSEGVFDRLNQEANDGYDALEWFAKQPESVSRERVSGS